MTNSVLILLKCLKEYVTVIIDMPTVATNVFKCINESLHIFNSRTCQLVLGAGATQLLHLKRITAKNLALASRCLSVIIALIPHFKIILVPLFPPKSIVSLNDLDRVKRVCLFFPFS